MAFDSNQQKAGARANHERAQHPCHMSGMVIEMWYKNTERWSKPTVCPGCGKDVTCKLNGGIPKHTLFLSATLGTWPNYREIEWREIAK